MNSLPVALTTSAQVVGANRKTKAIEYGLVAFRVVLLAVFCFYVLLESLAAEGVILHDTKKNSAVQLPKFTQTLHDRHEFPQPRSI